ncbi:MAG: C-GCAxxG-C-C family protein [Clostridia bacterium]|nr:C-GCAxxG-C-C family protein [Clostridia bacterium]MBQ7086689.1 C-GCAxxG-C-C family protein [Clostridia bacterium]
MKVFDVIDKYITRPEGAPKLNCAQITFLAANEAWNLGKEGNEDMLRGFGGGLNMGIVCGGVTGGVAALGYKYQGKMLREKTKLYINTVREKCGSENCIPLKDKYRTEEDGCKPTMQVIAQILDEIDATEIVIEEE